MDMEQTLASLAGFDAAAAGVEELRFESLPAGTYTFEGIEGKLDFNERDNVAYALMSFRVLECLTLEAKPDDPAAYETAKAKMVGKTHNERIQLVGEDLDSNKQIGRLMALYADMGLSNKGPLGGRAGNPGWLDGLAGHRFDGGIHVSTSKTDSTRKFANLRLTKKTEQDAQAAAA